MDRGW
jgi:hypothetical protein